MIIFQNLIGKVSCKFDLDQARINSNTATKFLSKMLTSFQTAKLSFSVLFIINIAMLIYTFAVGNITSEGSKLLQLPWGVYTFIDIYSMFIIFSGWIWFRTESLWARILGVLFTLVLGSGFCFLYILGLLFSVEDGDWETFYMGYKSKTNSLL